MSTKKCILGNHRTDVKVAATTSELEIHRHGLRHDIPFSGEGSPTRFLAHTRVVSGREADLFEAVVTKNSKVELHPGIGKEIKTRRARKEAVPSRKDPRHGLFIPAEIDWNVLGNVVGIEAVKDDFEVIGRGVLCQD